MNFYRFPVPVVDRFLFRVPGLGRLLETVGAIKGSVDECVAHLQPGHILKSKLRYNVFVNLIM